MYIHPFWAGVLAVLITQIGVLFIASIVTLVKRGKRNGN